MSTVLPATRRVAVVVLAGVLALLLGPAPAWAHTELRSSTPADGASVAQPPSQVELTFSEEVPAAGATVTVTGPDRVDRAAGPATGDGGTLTVPLRPLGPAGAYTVGYRVVSDDGHPVAGTVTFTLTAPGPAPAADGPPATGAPAAPAGAAGAGGGGTPVWPWLVGAVVVIGAGATLALRRTRS